MRLLRGPAVLFALMALPAAAAAGPVSVNVLLASQMVVPDPSPGTVHLPTSQPGDLVLDPGGEILVGRVQFDPQPQAQKADAYGAETPFSVFVKVTDTASGDNTTLRVDGTAVDVWIAGKDGGLINTQHQIDLSGGWTDLNPYVAQATLGGNAYTLRVDRTNNGTAADFVLSVGPASAVPEPATLLLAGAALLPVGLRALRNRKR